MTNVKIETKTATELKETDFETKETGQEALGLRMYCLVLRHLSPIQKGIQAAHAIVEYSLRGEESLYLVWADCDKTIVLLDVHSVSELDRLADELTDAGVKCNTFYEEDMGDTLTAVCFIANERAYDRKKYPNYEDWLSSSENHFGGDALLSLFTGEVEKLHNRWVETLGGEANVKIREVINSLRLAR